jgi:hypothetical protein
MPKQYLPLRGQPIALYSLDVFAAMREVGEVVVVCDESYDGVFRDHHARLPAGRPPLLFARPGAERQDSVCNGFAVRPACCGPRSPAGALPCPSNGGTAEGRSGSRRITYFETGLYKSV